MLPEAAIGPTVPMRMLSVIEQIQPRDQRTHRVPEQEIRQVGIAALHQVGQVLDILNKILPAVTSGKKSEIRRA